MSKQKTKNKVIKVSSQVHNYIVKRSGGGKISLDATLRAIFGLPTRKGKAQKRKHFWLLKKSRLSIFATRKEAKGEAIIRSVITGEKKIEKPMKVREVL